ncbi:hypothetical protein Hanom_Chr00s000001g01596301 [Helianthus anomalus]
MILQCFCIEPDPNRNTQNHQWNQELQDLDDELWSFVLVVMSLVWSLVLDL